jgi:hypothetical protein
MVSIRNTVVIFSLVKEKSFDKKIDKAYKGTTLLVLHNSKTLHPR